MYLARDGVAQVEKCQRTFVRDNGFVHPNGHPFLADVIVPTAREALDSV